MRKLLTLLLVFSASLGADETPDPRSPDQIVTETTAKILETVNTRREEFTENPELLREIVNRDMMHLLDIEYSARLILGRAGRGATPEQVDRFARAISNVLLSRYAEGLLEFRADEQFEVLPLKGKNTEKLTRVRTRINLDDGNSVPVDFAFRKTAGGWKAFDVTIEGISYVMTYRNQVASLIDASGIDQVTADIEAGNIALEN